MYNFFLLSGISVALFLFFGPAIRNLVNGVTKHKVETDGQVSLESDIWSFDEANWINTESKSKDKWVLN